MLKSKTIAVLLLIVSCTLNSCSVKLNGASIPAAMKTINIQFFENNAPLVVPYLSTQFTEALKTRIRNQSRLSLKLNDADATIEGRITGYDVSATSLTDNRQATAGTNRLTITISVKYTNNLEPKQSFEEPFSRYKEYPSAGQPLQSIEAQLITDINNQLTEDIFNRAFAQW
jgi:hypothetical protein